MKRTRKKLFTFQWKSLLIALFILLASQLVVSFIPFQLPSKLNLLVSVSAVVFYFLITNLKDEASLIRNTLATILIFGIAVCLTKPVQFGLDEESHLANAIRLADTGIFIREDMDMPDYSAIEQHDILRNSSNYIGRTEWMTIDHQRSTSKGKILSIISPAFLPNALGWNMGKIFSKKVFVSYYFGRIFNVLAYALLVLLALKISTKVRKFVAFTASFPAIIYICAGYHYDYLYFGLALIFLSLLTEVLSRDGSIRVKELWCFSIISFLFAFSKFPFILVGALMLMFPAKYYATKKVRISAIFFFFGEMFFSLLYYLNHNIFSYFNGVQSELSGSGASITHFIKHPLPFIRTIFDGFPITLDSFARPISYVTNDSRFLLYTSLTLFILLFLIICQEWNLVVAREFKLALVSVFGVIILLIIYAMSGDPRVYNLDQLFVGGVQGRYYFFMILMIPFFIAPVVQKVFGSSREKLQQVKDSGVFLQYSLAFINVLTLGVAIYTQVPHTL